MQRRRSSRLQNNVPGDPAGLICRIARPLGARVGQHRFPGRYFMTTRQLLPIFVLAIEALAPLGCGSHLVGDASNVSAMSGSYSVGDVASYSAEGSTTHFMLLNSRQNVLSSGFPGRDY
jgi:hypothetical protein